MKINITQTYKSISPTPTFELPDLTILTGKNGSGKTHLLESIHQTTSTVKDGENYLTKKQYIAYGKLIPNIHAAKHDVGVNNARNRLENLKRAIESHINATDNDDQIFNSLGPKNQHYFSSIMKRENVKITDITLDHLLVNMDLLFTSIDDNLFIDQIAWIFKRYSMALTRNAANEALRNKGYTDAIYLSDKDFVKKYGLPPWYLFNNILEQLNLPYEVNNPIGNERESDFDLKLKHKSEDIEIDVDELSTGEQTILSLVIAIYSNKNTDEIPQLLLLDEPDAPLHPSMSNLLLKIIKDQIINKYGIQVIMTTHSVATIACAPSLSLYKITHDNKIPNRCTKDDSIELLSKSILNFCVSIESKRTVFVEHDYDSKLYTFLFEILRDYGKISFITSPSFLQARGDGSNCADVIKIANALYKDGNRNVYGLIDWDTENKTRKNIVVLGGEKRYAIENYILEPHLLGLFLIDKKFILPEDIGFPPHTTFLNVCENISNATLQQIVNYVEKKINWGESKQKIVKSKLINGFTLDIREEYLTMNGHKLQSRCEEAWSELRDITRVKEDKKRIILREIAKTIRYFPELVSEDILNTFHSFK